MSIVISVENLSKTYRLGQIGTGTFTNDLKLWWAKARGKPNPLLKIGEKDHGNRDGEELYALRDISYAVEQGEALGIIGRNGAGKSTLLKILSRVTAPTSGKIKVKGRIASLLEVGTGFHPELTGRENIFLNGAILGMKRKEIERKFDEILDFAEVEKFIDTPVKRYSSGMYVRLAFSVAAHLEPEILIVDEVLAVGDATFQKKSLGKMGDVARTGRTVLFVSHNMDAVLSLCSSSLVLNNGQLVFCGKSEEAVRFYLHSSSQKSSMPSVIFERSLGDDRKSPTIYKIEIMDSSLLPKFPVYTWDEVVFRVHYVSDEEYRHGSFVLDICDYKQQRLLVLDSGIRFPIKKGNHYIECHIPRFPLSAGEYYLGAGLTLSNTQWLWRESNIGVINVHGKDVFNLGWFPSSTTRGFVLRSFFAAAYEWRK